MARKQILKVKLNNQEIVKGVFKYPGAAPGDFFSGRKVSKYDDKLHYDKDYILWSIAVSRYQNAGELCNIVQRQSKMFEHLFSSEVFEAEFSVAKVEMSTGHGVTAGSIMVESSNEDKKCLYSPRLIEELALSMRDMDSDDVTVNLTVLENWVLRDFLDGRDQVSSEIKLPVGKEFEEEPEEEEEEEEEGEGEEEEEEEEVSQG